MVPGVAAKNAFEPPLPSLPFPGRKSGDLQSLKRLFPRLWEPLHFGGLYQLCLYFFPDPPLSIEARRGIAEHIKKQKKVTSSSVWESKGRIFFGILVRTRGACAITIGQLRATRWIAETRPGPFTPTRCGLSPVREKKSQCANLICHAYHFPFFLSLFPPASSGSHRRAQHGLFSTIEQISGPACVAVVGL